MKTRLRQQGFTCMLTAADKEFLIPFLIKVNNESGKYYSC